MWGMELNDDMCTLKWLNMYFRPQLVLTEICVDFGKILAWHRSLHLLKERDSGPLESAAVRLSERTKPDRTGTSAVWLEYMGL